MLDFENFDFEDFPEEPYPDYFYEWDEALSTTKNLRFLEEEELADIIEIYLSEGEIEKARQTIEYALKFHPDDEDMIYDILLLLNDFELWNDLLAMTEQYSDISEVWVDGHKIAALFHLGMEEYAFLFFRKIRQKYENDTEQLSFIYQVLAESLQEMDLYDASLNVVHEAIQLLGDSSDFYWLQLEAYLSTGTKKQVLDMAAQIEQVDPMDGETWHRLGIVYFGLEEIEKAIDAFEFAESLGQKTQSNYLGLIAAYEKNENLLKALEKAKDYVYLYPDSYMVYALAASICSVLNFWEEALDYINTALKMAPYMDVLYLHKSRFLLHLGEQKRAVSALEEGIRQTQDKQGELKKELDKLHSEYPEE
jgi:tetratricopeptide (TPR) repeat protein